MKVEKILQGCDYFWWHIQMCNLHNLHSTYKYEVSGDSFGIEFISLRLKHLCLLTQAASYLI